MNLVTWDRSERSPAVGSAPFGAASSKVAERELPRPARLVLVEEGASLRDLEPPPSGCEHTVMMVQSQGERPAAFVQRVQRRLRSMRAEHRWTSAARVVPG